MEIGEVQVGYGNGANGEHGSAAKNDGATESSNYECENNATESEETSLGDED